MYKILYDKIINKICDEFGLNMNKFLNSHERPYMDIRHITRVLVFREFRLTLKEVGVLFNCSHSNIIYSVKQFDNYYQTDHIFRNNAIAINHIIDDINMAEMAAVNNKINYEHYYAGA